MLAAEFLPRGRLSEEIRDAGAACSASARGDCDCRADGAGRYRDQHAARAGGGDRVERRQRDVHYTVRSSSSHHRKTPKLAEPDDAS